MARLRIEIIIVLCVLLYVNTLIAISDFMFPGTIDDQDNCRTPDGAEGRCIVPSKCTPISDWLKNVSRPLSISDRNFLISYQCGLEVASIKVCCPNSSIFKPEISERASLIHSEIPNVSQHKHLKLLPQTNCGLIDTDDRILNGEMASLFEFPWMALISYITDNGLRFQCGGTVLNDRYILTAAHCLKDLKHKSIAGIRLGEYNISSPIDCEEYEDGAICASPIQDIAVDEIVPHPKFHRTSNKIVNDIGLIRLATKANLTANNVKPICLPISSAINSPNLTRATITGWGQTTKDITSDVLMKLDVDVLPHKKCVELYKNISVPITKEHLCSAVEKARDSCRGDSGGPLQWIMPVEDSDLRYVQYGILSFGSKICGTENPAVYTKVVKYLDWILDNIKP